MTTELVKGEKFNLTKKSGGATDFYIGLSWDVPTNNTSGHSYDLDASVFGCKYDGNQDPKLLSDDYFVFFNNLKTRDGAIEHSGDNLTGDGAGDDEQIRIHLSKLNPAIDEISVIVAIYDAATRRQNFGMVKRAKIRVCKMDTAGNPTEELASFALTDDYSAFTALHPGSIYKRDDGDWAFSASGAGFDGGLAAATKNYTA